MNDLPTPPVFEDFRSVISLWESRSALAVDLRQPHWLIEAWWRKNSIPPRWFDELTRAAIKRDFEGISNDMLLKLHVKRVESGPVVKKKTVREGADA